MVNLLVDHLVADTLRDLGQEALHHGGGVPDDPPALLGDVEPGEGPGEEVAAGVLEQGVVGRVVVHQGVPQAAESMEEALGIKARRIVHINLEI